MGELSFFLSGLICIKQRRVGQQQQQAARRYKSHLGCLSFAGNKNSSGSGGVLHNGAVAAGAPRGPLKDRKKRTLRGFLCLKEDLNGYRGAGRAVERCWLGGRFGLSLQIECGCN